MDQRVDNERQPDSERLESPGRRAPPSFDEAGDKGSWRQRFRKRRGFIQLLVIGGIIVAALLVGWWLHARNYESTDDAFIDSRTVQISAQVAAAIVDVPVTDNQLVDAGTELVRLDDRDYVAQRDQAQAQVNQAQASIDNLTAQIAAQQAKIDQANKQVVQAQAALTFARQQAERYQQLASKGSGTVEQAQQYVSNQQQSEAGLAAAEANATATEKQIGVLQAQRDLAYGQLTQARATLEQARANLARTIITAPVAGRVIKLTAAKGGYAAVGQALMMFVPREVWVTANFKETQLNLMHPGQPVDIAIDAYPGRTFAGHVDSVQSGSGTAFSLLPAENATGNYVKIVQRVPVKITFDKMPDVLLGPGMSVVPTVKVR
ncbi:MAG TPA: HlyD family secretion protein [Xanthobacteraceae bacterium]|jgi:membrane fusion protein (multidrug efflux system)|nr:HlyD family secretion protein [Xanthobacteraceae bacterium]